MVSTARFIVLVIAVSACGAAAHPAPVTQIAADPAPAKLAEPPRAPDPDLHRPPPRKLLDIDWTKVVLTDDSMALALWRRIAPSGADWDDKLQEIPSAAARPLALAVLHGGNFLCAPPPTGACARPLYDVAPPDETAGFADPCLRRLLALWSIDQITDDDLPIVHDALLAIAALPPPESQLVAAAIHTVPEADQEARLAMLAVAWRAGQRDLVSSALGGLDEAHLFAAVRQHHIDSAVEILSPEAHREVYLAAVNDEALGTRARTGAISELAALTPGEDKLPPDLATALATAAKSKDCSVAAAAARALDQHGDHRFVPRKPRTANTAHLMRAMCVLASYEALLHNDESSLVPSYVPARGLERVTFTYDPLSEDGNTPGDPHVTRSAELVPRAEAVLPELEDLVRAMAHCAGAICVSEDHEFRFVWQSAGGDGLLSRIELADRPPCTPGKPNP